MFWRHVVVPNQVSPAQSMAGARYNLSLINEQSLSLSGYERNQLFHNAGSFFEVGSVVGLDSILDGRGVAGGDLDGDGDVDLVVSNRNFPHVTVLRNDHPARNHSIAVVLRGTRSNRMGIGARITASCDGRSQVRVVSLGEGFISQGDTAAWFGLGDCRRVERLEIDWPSGARQVFEDVPADRRVVVTEDRSEWEAVPFKPRNPTLVQPEPVRRPTRGEQPQLAVPAPGWTLPRAESSAAERVRYDPSGPSDDLPPTLLVNFWATWCAACVHETTDLVELHAALEPLGVEIVGISVDDGPPMLVKRYARWLEIPYPVLHDRQGEVFQRYVRLLGLGSGTIPLSVLIHDGVIRRVYLGRVDPDEIVAAVRSLSSK